MQLATAQWRGLDASFKRQHMFGASTSDVRLGPAIFFGLEGLEAGALHDLHWAEPQGQSTRHLRLSGRIALGFVNRPAGPIISREYLLLLLLLLLLIAQSKHFQTSLHSMPTATGNSNPQPFRALGYVSGQPRVVKQKDAKGFEIDKRAGGGPNKNRRTTDAFCTHGLVTQGVMPGV